MNPTQFKTVASIFADHLAKCNALSAEIVACIIERSIHHHLFAVAASQRGVSAGEIKFTEDFHGNNCETEIRDFIKESNNPNFDELCVEIRRRMAASGWSVPKCKIWSEYLHGFLSMRMDLILVENVP